MHKYNKWHIQVVPLTTMHHHSFPTVDILLVGDEVFIWSPEFYLGPFDKGGPMELHIHPPNFGGFLNRNGPCSLHIVPRAIYGHAPCGTRYVVNCGHILWYISLYPPSFIYSSSNCNFITCGWPSFMCSIIQYCEIFVDKVYNAQHAWYFMVRLLRNLFVEFKSCCLKSIVIFASLNTCKFEISKRNGVTNPKI